MTTKGVFGKRTVYGGTREVRECWGIFMLKNNLGNCISHPQQLLQTMTKTGQAHLLNREQHVHYYLTTNCTEVGKPTLQLDHHH